MIKQIIKRLIKLETKKPKRVTSMSNIIMRDSMGYPLRLCILNDGTQIWIDTYEEFIGEYDRDLKLISVDIPFGNIVFPLQRGIEE